MQPPVLVDAPVVLRALTGADTDEVLARWRDEDVVRWTTVPVPYGRPDAAAFIARTARGWADGDRFVLGVYRDGRSAGHVALRPDGARGAELAYVLSPWARRRGVMSRAVRAMLRWAFDELDLDVVHWRSLVGNWPSRRVAWACGFTVEGRVRGLVAQRGERRDAWIGSLRRGDPMRPASTWLEVPELRAGALVLRPNHPGDAERMVQACNDPVTQRWLPELPSPYTVEDARWYLESRPEANASGEGVYWAVADPDDDRLLAQVGLMGLHAGARTGEIGYWTHPDARGAGVMATAVRLVARHALLPVEDGGVGLSRVQLRVARGNDASARVAEKAGFTRCGVDRQAERLRDGTLRDFIRFDLLVDEMEQAWAHPSALR